MNVYIAVAIGGALGAVLRFGISQYIAYKGILYPWGTVVVNVLGSMLIGLGMAYFQGHPSIPPWVKLLCITGCLGGLTTFSTFIFDGYVLLEKGIWPTLWYMLGQLILGFLLCGAAFTLGKRLWF